MKYEVMYGQLCREALSVLLIQLIMDLHCVLCFNKVVKVIYR